MSCNPVPLADSFGEGANTARLNTSGTTSPLVPSTVGTSVSISSGDSYAACAAPKAPLMPLLQPRPPCAVSFTLDAGAVIDSSCLTVDSSEASSPLTGSFCQRWLTRNASDVSCATHGDDPSVDVDGGRMRWAEDEDSASSPVLSTTSSMVLPFDGRASAWRLPVLAGLMHPANDAGLDPGETSPDGIVLNLSVPRGPLRSKASHDVQTAPMKRNDDWITAGYTPF